MHLPGWQACPPPRSPPWPQSRLECGGSGGGSAWYVILWTPLADGVRAEAAQRRPDSSWWTARRVKLSERQMMLITWYFHFRHAPSWKSFHAVCWSFLAGLSARRHRRTLVPSPGRACGPSLCSRALGPARRGQGPGARRRSLGAGVCCQGPETGWESGWRDRQDVAAGA